MRRLVAVSLVLLMFGTMALSAEPPPAEEPAVVAVAGEVATPSPAVEKPIWLDFAATVLTAIGQGVLAIFLAWVLKKARDNLVMQDAVRALGAGVDDAWVNFVKELKDKASDGKLTPEEKGEARAWALNKAKEVVSGSGRRLLESMGGMAINALISKIVRKRKSGG